MAWTKDRVFNNGQEFVDWLDKEYGELVTKRISFIDVHHTWKPNHSYYPDKTTLEMHQNMRNYHVNNRGWYDIGQHITIGKDGLVVLGLPIEKTPASAYGYNGSLSWHPFMYEMIGNFDLNVDKLEGAQLTTVNAINHYFHIKKDKPMRFHREMDDSKSCPGTGLKKSWMIEQAKKYVKEEPKMEPKEQIVSPFAKEAFEWVKKEALSDGSRPQDALTRQEFWTILHRYDQKKGE